MNSYVQDNVIRSNSSNGRLYKQFIGNKLIKTGSIHDNGFEQQFNYEAVEEYLVYKIGTYLGIPNKLITRYELCNITVPGMPIRTVGCECELFTSGDESYLSFYNLLSVCKIPFNEMFGEDTYNKIVEVYTYFLKDRGIREGTIVKYLNTMFLLDSLTLNSDRHLGNFGFISSKSGEILRIAPIFDNGNSLFCNKPFRGMEYDPSLNRYIADRPLSGDFNNLFNYIDIRNSYINIEKLGTLVKYVEHLCENLKSSGILPEDRVQFILGALRYRSDIFIRQSEQY